MVAHRTFALDCVCGSDAGQFPEEREIHLGCLGACAERHPLTVPALRLHQNALGPRDIAPGLGSALPRGCDLASQRAEERAALAPTF